MYPGLARGGGGGVGGDTATPPSIAACSCHCVWTDYGRPSVHTTLSIDPGSAKDICRPAAAGHISILDALTWLVGPTVTSQLLQHENALDITLTYRVGC
jgi:hypothetical protein